MKATSVFVYGAGRVGRAIARAIEAHGHEHGLALCGAWNRSFGRALASSRLLSVEVSAGDAIPEAFERAEVILLSVSDDAVAERAALLARHMSPRQRLLHTSGSLTASVMSAPGMRAGLGSVHPLQALADDDGDPAQLVGSTFAVEGTPEALEVARRVALACGGTPVEIPPQARVYYHAAAVMAANYQTVLVDAACALLAEAGVEPAVGVRMLAPLLRGTLNHVEARAAEADAHPATSPLARALTGPARRGDVGTVEKHLAALGRLARRHPEAADLPDLYRLLGRRAARLAAQADLEPQRAEALLAALEDPEPRS